MGPVLPSPSSSFLPCSPPGWRGPLLLLMPSLPGARPPWVLCAAQEQLGCQVAWGWHRSPTVPQPVTPQGDSHAWHLTWQRDSGSGQDFQDPYASRVPMSKVGAPVTASPLPRPWVLQGRGPTACTPECLRVHVRTCLSCTHRPPGRGVLGEALDRLSISQLPPSLAASWAAGHRGRQVKARVCIRTWLHRGSRPLPGCAGVGAGAPRKQQPAACPAVRTVTGSSQAAAWASAGLGL